MRRSGLLVFFLLIFISFAAAQKKSIKEKTKDFQKFEGYLTYYWDPGEGKIWLEIEHFDREFLYVNSLTAGVGSNDIGLDRNQLGDTRIVYFDRRGPKILLVQPNYSFRAITDNKAERRSVEDAFANSVLWGFKVEAEEKDRVLVDATEFLMRDAHDVTGRLRATGQGSYSPDASRSAVYLPGTLNFPENSEFEVTLTFKGSNPGGQVRSVAPTPEAITVRQHHSFVQLPDSSGYEPRTFDPRSGYFGIGYQDYSTPIGESLTKRFITRHRLKKKNPDAEISEPVEPIIYYLDRGTPEPVRSALIEGAEWWNQAFEAAGYKNAFQVNMLPEDAHPLDVRYNVINWVHRSTRGWSYGSSVVDPRTGEIIKGHVLLGSLRVRQDYLIAEGLLGPYDNGIPEDDPMLEMALARIRQLSAHEVGHTLGLAHNFASSVNNRASVMDYPHPKVKIDDNGNFDLSDAYDTGIGEWDKVTIAYGYQDFPAGTDEEEALTRIIDTAIDDGLLFISDFDARPEGGAHPSAHLWDYGDDPVAQMSHILAVRAKALDTFSEANIKPGAPLATLEDVLVPIYLFHRYQLEGTVKLIGGLNYFYNVRGDGQPGPAPVPPGRQRAALDAMLETMKPDILRLPDALIELIPPRPLGYYGSRELFNRYTDPAFDPLGAAETAAGLTANLLFNAERAARLVDFEARNNDFMGLDEMIERVLNQTIKSEKADGYDGAIQRTVDYVVLYHLMDLARDDDASNQVRAVVHRELETLNEWLRTRTEQVEDESVKAAYTYMSGLIEDFKENPERLEALSEPLSPPPGSPIGSGHSVLNCNF